MGNIAAATDVNDFTVLARLAERICATLAGNYCRVRGDFIEVIAKYVKSLARLRPDTQLLENEQLQFRHLSRQQLDRQAIGQETLQASVRRATC